MATTFEDDDHRISEQLSRDHEREGGYGTYLPWRRPITRLTLIPKFAAGVIQPLVVILPTKKGGGR
jgi:hypothetical protein